MLFTNYVTSAWRNILRHKLFSSINILGLAIGLAAVMLIALYVRYETSYDSFWKNADNIYRIQTSFNNPGQTPIPVVTVPGPLIHALKKDFPQIIHATRITQFLEPTVRIDEQHYQDHIRLVDAEINNVFDLEVLAGDLDVTLNDNRSVALSESRAIKYFGQKNPIGQTITVIFGELIIDYKVSAVFKDIPDNSMLDVGAFALLDTNDWPNSNWLEGWFSPITQTYYTLPPSADLDAINGHMVEFLDRNYPSSFSRREGSKPSDELSLFSIALKDIHLKAVGLGERKPRGNITAVVIYSAVAILILIIATINFMNLSTVRASGRAKEVSLRKTVGASRSKIIVQFLGEAVFLSLFSLFLALALVETILPFYKEFLGTELIIDYTSVDLYLIILLTVCVGLVAGIYPAFILSRFKPAKILKSGHSTEPMQTNNLRSLLVVFQFSISIALMVSTAVVYGQMFYALNMDLGYTKENLLIINEMARDELRPKRINILNHLKTIPGVVSATNSIETPGLDTVSNSSVRLQDAAPEDAKILRVRTVGFDYFETYDIPILTGRSFDFARNDEAVTIQKSYDNPALTTPIVVNQQALTHLGIKDEEQAINQKLFIKRGSGENEKEVPLEIIGVVPDVHFESIRTSINPEMNLLSLERIQSLSIRFSGDPQLVIENIQKVWQEHAPDVPIVYEFADDLIAKQYQAERNEMTMFAAFAALAIFVACLGLYGLASYTTKLRTKEIGIRKVFGAQISHIVRLLLWQFSKPVIIANLIAWPIAFYSMSRWLENFVYRIDNIIIVSLCLIAGLCALLIAWATVASNSYAVARQSPIKALRYE